MNPYEAPDTAEPVLQKSITEMPRWFSVMMTVDAFAGLIASIGMVAWSAETEPFFGPFNLWHAVISLAFGGAGFLFWIVWGAGILMAVWKRWLPHVALALLLLALFGLLLNGIVVTDYLGDRQQWAQSGPF